MKAKFEKLMVLVVLLMMVLVADVGNAKLVAYWGLDGSADDSIGSNHGTIVGNPTWETGRLGGALLFDGDDYVVIPNESEFDFTDAMTVACWIKVRTFDKQWQAIVTKGDNSWRIARTSDENTVALHCTGVTSNNNGRNSNFGVEGNIIVNDGKWHHVAGVYDGSKIYIYVDGTLDRALSASGKISKGDYQVYIGENAERRGRQFNGLIDDVAIFDHALSEQEVAQLYRLGAASFTSEPMLLILLEAVRESEALLKEQKPQKAIAFLEKKVAEYEQWKEKNPTDIKLAHKGLSSELYFLLAKAKEDAGAPKNDITQTYKRAIESGTLSPPRQGPALLWLYENVNTDEYEKIIEPLIQNNTNYLKEVAAQAEMMVHQQNPKAAIKFLEGNLTAYAYWQEKHPFDDVAAEHALPGVYFQIAKAKEAIGTPKQEIADAYSKTFNPSRFGYAPERTAALIWLLENECKTNYTNVIKSFTQDRQVEDALRTVVGNVCKHFESQKDWARFERFLDTLFTEAKYPYDWAILVESCFSDKTNRWAKTYFDYLDKRPRLKFGRDCLVAERYAAGEKFKEAAELYRDIVNRCGPEDDKGAFEFQLCKCLFDGGQYRQAIPEIESFIANNKAKHRSLVKEAMLMKGRSHVQLGELDKAIDSFFTMMVEYPETKEAPETHFFVGYCYMLQRKFDLATDAFDCVIKGYPQSAYASKAQLCMTRIKSMAQ
ncbi:MAG: LamG domain-containing protein [Planctomycetota bacterium]|nr:LamG domain-containing protein [Planctomycetota bacterium]